MHADSHPLDAYTHHAKSLAGQGKTLHLHTLHAFNYLHIESQLPKQLLRVLQLRCVLRQIYEVRPVGHLRMLPTLAIPPAVLVPCLHALVCSCVC
jgi:hypothetical protein